MSILVQCAELAVTGTMHCERCGASRRFDARLPYVQQTSSFAAGHDCRPGAASIDLTEGESATPTVGESLHVATAGGRPQP